MVMMAPRNRNRSSATAAEANHGQSATEPVAAAATSVSSSRRTAGNTASKRNGNAASAAAEAAAEEAAASMDKNSDEYRRKRERNNLAVKKSRSKSKMKTQETLERVNKLRAENEMLEAKITLLSKELGFLKDLFLAHAGSAHSQALQDLDLTMFGEPTAAGAALLVAGNSAEVAKMSSEVKNE